MKSRLCSKKAFCVMLFVLALAGRSHAQLENPVITNCTTITAPGSYVLLHNLTATASNVQTIPVTGNRACILIDADFVTLDMAGFAITGSNLGSLIVSGVVARTGIPSTEHQGIHVRAGTVANLTGSGVLLFGKGHTVENVRALNNFFDGIVVAGSAAGGHRIIGNVAVSNGASGITVLCPAVVLENSASGNGGGIPGQEIVQIINPNTNSACTSQENSPVP